MDDQPPPYEAVRRESHELAVTQLMELTNMDDPLLIRSLLEATNWSVPDALEMCAESHKAHEQLNVDVTVDFEGSVYKFKMRPADTLVAVKEELVKETNIIPTEQMLVDSETQTEVPPGVKLAELRNAASQVKLFLLSPNSAA